MKMEARVVRAKIASGVFANSTEAEARAASILDATFSAKDMAAMQKEDAAKEAALEAERERREQEAAEQAAADGVYINSLSHLGKYVSSFARRTCHHQWIAVIRICLSQNSVVDEILWPRRSGQQFDFHV